MELKSLLVDSKTTWVEFPGSPDFEVELANLSRKELQNLRKNCIQNKFNRKTRMYEESLDDEKFVKEFTLKTVKGWAILCTIALGAWPLLFWVLKTTEIGSRLSTITTQAEQHTFLQTETAWDLFGDRGYYYYHGWELFLEAPLTGIGLVNFPSASGFSTRPETPLFSLPGIITPYFEIS